MVKHGEDHQQLLNDHANSHLEEDDELVSKYHAENEPSTYTFSRKRVNLFVVLIFIPTTLMNFILSLALYKSKVVSQDTHSSSQYGMVNDQLVIER